MDLGLFSGGDAPADAVVQFNGDIPRVLEDAVLGRSHHNGVTAVYFTADAEVHFHLAEDLKS